MKCYYCEHTQSSVVDKREVKSTGEIRRRRECLKCHRRYTTYERVCAVELTVLKRDGRREPFNADKLRAGIEKALEKRPAVLELDNIVGKIESKIKAKSYKEVESKVIGRLVLSELKKTDKVAYLRFASVYRHFEGLMDFTKELEHLKV